MGLLAEKRHIYILDQLRSNGRVEVADIARQLNVTEVTIRRDLTQLQKNTMLKKTHGGAILTEPPEVNMSVRFRQTRNLLAKRTIGRLAADLVSDGDNIYLEAGSTCYELIPHLRQYKNLTIIVNSLYLMNRLHELTSHKVIITGGQYRPNRMDMIGPAAEATITQLAGFTAFTSADDISIDTGISGADVATASFTRQVLRKATRAIFVGTHNKFDKAALYKIAEIEDLEAIVTDTPPTKKWHHAAKQKNITLIYPKEK